MKLEKKTLAALVALGATAMTAAWGNEAGAQTPKKGGVLNIAVVAGIRSCSTSWFILS